MFQVCLSVSGCSGSRSHVNPFLVGLCGENYLPQPSALDLNTFFPNSTEKNHPKLSLLAFTETSYNTTAFPCVNNQTLSIPPIHQLIFNLFLKNQTMSGAPATKFKVADIVSLNLHLHELQNLTCIACSPWPPLGAGRSSLPKMKCRG